MRRRTSIRRQLGRMMARATCIEEDKPMERECGLRLQVGERYERRDLLRDARKVYEMWGSNQVGSEAEYEMKPGLLLHHEHLQRKTPTIRDRN